MRVISAIGGLVNVAKSGAPAANSAYVIGIMRGHFRNEAGELERFLLADGIGVGYGARPNADGIDAVYFVAQENYPVEFLEVGYPVRLRTYGIVRDSGGAGRFRGGCGIVREYEILAEDAMLAIRIDSIKNPPWGIDGGMSGGTGRAVINPGTSRERVLAPLSDGNGLVRGDILRIETGGGGGYGHPFDRPAEAVLEDVLGGYVSREAAERLYGVVLDGDRVDEDATAEHAHHAPPFAVSIARSMSMSSPETSLSIAVDIGGTFTDISLLDRATGQVWRAKTPSVPDDPSEAFMTGIKLALADAGAPATALDQVLHGTTVATNMILEGKGARSALVTTRGFRHVLAIGRQDIPRKANLYTWVKPERPVPASRILEIDERLAAGGSVLQPLDEESVLKAAEAIRRMDVGAVGICLMHAFANPEHERRTAEILRSELPGIAVTMSTDVLPVVREYERSLTTVLNATVMPGVTTYVGRLEQRLNEREGEGAPPAHEVQRRCGRSGSDPASACLDGPVGPGRRGGRRSRDRRRLRHQRYHYGRYRWDQRRHMSHQGR